MVPTNEGIAVVHIRRARMRVQYERYLNSKTGRRVSNHAVTTAVDSGGHHLVQSLKCWR